MIWLLIRHRVADYATWKPAFDSHHDTITAAGGTVGFLMRDADDPNLISVGIAWASLDRAQAFIASPDLKAKMEESGVIGAPDVYLMDVLEELDFSKPLPVVNAA